MNSTRTWYQNLKKPCWAPPGWLFSPVWTVLYILIIISFGSVFYDTYTGDLPYMVAIPFALNLLFNLIFPPIQFRLQNNYLSSADVLIILITLIWSMSVIFPYQPWIMWINVPYLLWVSFATILQLAVSYMNKK